MRLFNEENSSVIISTEAKLVPEFKKLYTRDRSRGRKEAVRELSYVFFMLDYRSPYTIYSKEERDYRLRTTLGFPEGWKPDAAVKAALSKYEEFMVTPAARTLSAIREGLITSTKVIETLTADLQMRMDNFLIQDEEEEGVDKSGMLTKMLTQIQSLLKISDSLPSTINTLDALEEKIKKEQSGNSRIKGGGRVGDYED